MRMNRGTVLLLAISLVVIVAVLALTFSQATAPGDDGETPIAEGTETQPVAVFAGVDQATVQRVEVRNNQTGERTVVRRVSADEWEVVNPRPPASEQDLTGVSAEATAEATQAPSVNLEVDQGRVDNLLSTLLNLQAEDAFEAEDLAQYGLNTPSYVAFVVGEADAVHVMYIGSENPSGTRYYAVVEQIGDASTRPDLDLMEPDLERLDIDTSLTGADLVDSEGLQQNPTLQALATAMREEEDEDAQQTLAATYQAIIEATNVAAATEAAEATAEATDETEATAEATSVAQDVERPEVQTSIETLEATVEVGATQPAPATAEAEETVEPVAGSITLEGPRTVYLVNAQAIRAIIGIIDDQPLIEVEATAPPIQQELGTEEPSDFDSIPTPEVTAPAAEATAEATAES